MRNLTLQGEIFIFKTIAISKIVLESLMISATKYVVNKLEKNTKDFFME